MIEMSSEKVAALVRSQAALGPVCNELARLDLEAMVGSSGCRVTVRELAVRWGWSKSVVGRWLRQLDRFELAANPSGSRIRRVGEARDSQSPGSTPLPSRGGTRRRRRPLPPVPHPRKGMVPPLYPPPRHSPPINRDERRRVAEAWRSAAGSEPTRPVASRLRQLQEGYAAALNGSGVATLERDIDAAFRHFAGKPPRYVLACLEGRVEQGAFGKPWRRHTSTGHTIQRAAGRRSFAEISE